MVSDRAANRAGARHLRKAVVLAGVLGIFGLLAPYASAGSWQTTRLDTGPVEITLFGISCPSASLCVSVGSDETIATSTDPQGGGAWQAIQPAGGLPVNGPIGIKVSGAQIRGVSCPAGGFCVAVAFEGKIYTSAEPTAGPGAWRVIETSAEHSPRVHLTAVSCATTSMCVAVAYGGKILASTDPADGVWSLTQLPTPADLRGIACPSSSFCVAVDNTGNIFISANPTAAEPTWQSIPEPAGPSSLGAVSCAGLSLCVTADAGQILRSTAPVAGSWRTVVAGTGYPVTGLACPTIDACAAVDNNADVITSTEPSGGGGAWSDQNVLPSPPTGEPNGMFAISCPETGFCAAAGQSGQIITSSNPFAEESEDPPAEKPRRPRVTITRHPLRRLDQHRHGRVVRFGFRADRPVGHFSCRLNRRALSSCHSPRSYRVGKGIYTFRVFAVTAAGLRSPTARFRFRVGPLEEGPPNGSCDLRAPLLPGDRHPCIPGA